MAAEARDGTGVTASYDAYGRLATYTRTGTPSFAMLYSGTDERVQVSVDGTPRRFAHDESGRVIGEYGGTGTVFAEHVWLMPDTPEDLGQGGWEPLALLGASTLSYVHGDHLGVPVQITDASGATVNAMQADPFGQRFYTASTSAPRTSLALPGQIIDIADRHYNLYRDYDPTLGRYLQADPIGLEGGDNVYEYVGGNPVGWIDPVGLQRYAGQLPPKSIPGGPWTPAGSGQPPGTFYGPPNGSNRMTCRFVPDGRSGGPQSAPQSYWKTKPNGAKNWTRYDRMGNPITAEQAHPSNPTSEPWNYIRWVGRLGIVGWLLESDPAK